MKLSNDKHRRASFLQTPVFQGFANFRTEMTWNRQSLTLGKLAIFYFMFGSKIEGSNIMLSYKINILIL